jgi:hypothetical protein
VNAGIVNARVGSEFESYPLPVNRWTSALLRKITASSKRRDHDHTDDDEELAPALRWLDRRGARTIWRNG